MRYKSLVATVWPASSSARTAVLNNAPLKLFGSGCAKTISMFMDCCSPSPSKCHPGATIDVQDRARCKAIGEQIDDRLRNVFGCARAAYGQRLGGASEHAG